MNIAIIGLGLIGGSIGLKLKAQNLKFKVIGIPRRQETLTEAIKRGAIDSGTTDLKQGIAQADLVFLCTPINLIPPLLKEIAPSLKTGVIVTDVGSSKSEIVSQAEKLLSKGVYFVGGHPMAGKEQVKLAAAVPDLFQNKTWILTPTSKTNKKALAQVTDLIKLLGANVAEMGPQVHDLAVAGVSHMPLAVAAALVNSIQDSEKAVAEMKTAAASGLRDTTRVASGDPVLGVDMFTTNKKAVLKTLTAFKQSLAKLERLIKAGEVEAIENELERAKVFRDSLYG